MKLDENKMDAICRLIEKTRKETINHDFLKLGLKTLLKLYTSLNDIEKFYKIVDLSVLQCREQSKDIQHRIVCKKGCGSCCNIGVEIGSLEAKSIVDYIVKNKIEISIGKLTKQSGTIASNWESLGHDKSCVFLKNNICQIYEVRPVACRLFLVCDDVSKCNDLLKKENNILFFRPIKLDIIKYCMLFCENLGDLPSMILSELKNKN